MNDNNTHDSVREAIIMVKYCALINTFFIVKCYNVIRVGCGRNTTVSRIVLIYILTHKDTLYIYILYMYIYIHTYIHTYVYMCVFICSYTYTSINITTYIAQYKKKCILT